MKSYLSRTKANSRRSLHRKRLGRIVLWVIAAFLGVWLLAHFLGGIFSYVVKPLYLTKEWFLESSETIPSFFRSQSELLGEIKDLETQLSEHSGDAATIGRLVSENKELRALLGVSEETRIAAGVIGRPPGVPYDQLYLDRGARDEIRLGAYVYFAGDQAIGYVSRLFETSAVVRLFSSPGTRLTVYVIGPDIYTYATGRGGGVIQIVVPQGILLQEGNTVVLPTISPAVIGRVQTVDSIATEPEQRGYVSSDVSMQEIRFVTIGERTVEEVSFEEARNNVENSIERLLLIEVPEDIIVDTSTTTVTSTTTDESI